MVPKITLRNGVRVANFSSPHPFNFVSGEVLPACDAERVALGSLDRTEATRDWPGLPGVTAVVPCFRLTDLLQQMLQELQDDDTVDVIIVPFPVLEAIRTKGFEDKFSKAATICVADRLTKAIHPDRFCR